MRTALRIHRKNLIAGSVGFEYLSAILKFYLSARLLSGRPAGTSILLSILATRYSTFWIVFLLCCGVTHLLSLGHAGRSSWRWVRKGCCIVAITLWSTLIFDATQRGNLTLVVLLAVPALSLFIAVGRSGDDDGL